MAFASVRGMDAKLQILKNSLIEYLWRCLALSRGEIRECLPWLPSGLDWLQEFQQDPPAALKGLKLPLKRPLAALPLSPSPFPCLSTLDSRFPESLRTLADPPVLLYYLGDAEIISQKSLKIAVVGTRRATDYGRSMTERFVRGMAAYPVVIVSGMAMGIDGVAHRSALSSGLATVGVLGTALDRPYPQVHQSLFRELADQGLLLSEVYPGAKMGPWRFPERNRLLAALADAVLVVEAPLRSGALITAHLALELGKEVFVIPGPCHPPANAGGHRLIQEGAHLVTAPQEMMEILASRLDTVVQICTQTEQDYLKINQLVPQGRTAEEREILRILSKGPLCIDKIIHISQKTPPIVTATLGALVLQEWVRERPGGNFELTI